MNFQKLTALLSRTLNGRICEATHPVRWPVRRQVLFSRSAQREVTAWDREDDGVSGVVSMGGETTGSFKIRFRFVIATAAACEKGGESGFDSFGKRNDFFIRG